MKLVLSFRFGIENITIGFMYNKSRLLIILEIKHCFLPVQFPPTLSICLTKKFF